MNKWEETKGESRKCSEDPPQQGAEVLAVMCRKKVEAMSPEPQIYGALRYGTFLPTIEPEHRICDCACHR